MCTMLMSIDPEILGLKVEADTTRRSKKQQKNRAPKGMVPRMMTKLYCTVAEDRGENPGK